MTINFAIPVMVMVYSFIAAQVYEAEFGTACAVLCFVGAAFGVGLGVSRCCVTFLPGLVVAVLNAVFLLARGDAASSRQLIEAVIASAVVYWLMFGVVRCLRNLMEK